MEKEFKLFMKAILTFWFVYVLISLGALFGAIYLISKLFT